MSERRAFGDRMRRQRERRAVTLQAIAHATKVSASLFAALERGDCSRWPGGVYSRAYVRAYAEAIGVDPDEAVEDFTAAFAETALPDSSDREAVRRVRATNPFRLTIDDQPDVRHDRLSRRAAFAAADLAVAFGLAWLAHLALDTTTWTTVGVALAYHASGRLLTDQSLVAWLFTRSKTPVPADNPSTEEVPVSDPARTTA